ncbi:MAG: M48 family metalloprotease, partial [Campylobacterales bacterium]|nr:M48 family metalloprotease [Campylobacterales bacterium]
KHEFEEDELGIKLMAKANYDTSEALTFWQGMMKHSNQEGFAFLSTHPSTTDRIENIKRIIQTSSK